MNAAPESVNWLPLLIPLAAVAGALLLVWLAWRGRRVGTHPVCRKCGFDLRGLPEDAVHCSECGADVRQPKATRIGERRRSAGKVAAASFVLLIALGWLAIAGWSASGRLDVQPFKPAWLLLRETRSADVKVRDAALAELVRRYDGSQLPEARLKELVRQGLALQADKTKPWNEAWGEIIEKAYDAGKLPNDQWQQYLANINEPTVEVRPVVRRGDPIPYWTGWTASRGGRRVIDIKVKISAVDFDGAVQLAPPGMSGSTFLNGPSSGGRSMGSSLRPDRDSLRKLDDGLHRVRFTYDVVMSDSTSRGGPEAKKQVVVEAPVQLVPAGQETVKVVNDPALRSAVQSALQVTRLELVPAESRDARLDLTVSTTPPPVGLGYEVFVRSDDREWPAGRFARPAGGKPHGFGIGGEVQGFEAEKVDVVFRPSVAAAVNTTDTAEIWNGEVVIRDVPVKRREK